jgi:hypothetical protein
MCFYFDYAIFIYRQSSSISSFCMCISIVLGDFMFTFYLMQIFYLFDSMGFFATIFYYWLIETCTIWIWCV